MRRAGHRHWFLTELALFDRGAREDGVGRAYVGPEKSLGRDGRGICARLASPIVIETAGARSLPAHTSLQIKPLRGTFPVRLRSLTEQ